MRFHVVVLDASGPLQQQVRQHQRCGEPDRWTRSCWCFHAGKLLPPPILQLQVLGWLVYLIQKMTATKQLYHHRHHSLLSLRQIAVQ